MSTNFPTSLDTLTNPTATSNTVTVPHATQHANANDAIEALEAKVGINSSAVATSLDYKVTNASSSNPGHKHTILGGAISDIVVTNPQNGNGLFYNSTSGKYENADTSVADASTTTKGVVKLKEAPASATEPIAVGDNDSRFTTLSSGALNGSTNKIVDQASVTEAKTASKIPIRDANSDILVATTPTAGDAAASKTYVDSISSGFYSASDTLIQSADTARGLSGTTLTKKKEMVVSITGTIRVYFETQASQVSGNAQIYRNGIAYGTSRASSSGAYVGYSEDLFFNVGDLVQLYVWGNDGSAVTNVQNFRLKGTLVYVRPTLTPVVTLD